MPGRTPCSRSSTRRPALALGRGLENPLAQDELIQQKQEEVLRQLAAYGLTRDQCTLLWIKFSLDYFRYNAPDEIAWQTRLILTNPPGNLPLVVIRPVTTPRLLRGLPLHPGSQPDLQPHHRRP
jgi:UTP:GlnB (protein PII) uridylyltransferase